MLDEFNGDFLQWLRGFYHVAKTGSLRRAAEIMHRNPSTLSYQIRSLEEELGTVLFDRYKKSLHITTEGKKLLEWTVTTFETLQNMRSEVSTVGGVLQGGVTFASTLPFSSLAVEPIARFQEQNPKVNIHILRALPANIITKVRESRVDFGLLGVIQKPSEDPIDILFKARPLLVAHRDNPWNIPPVPTLETLQKLPFISFKPAEEGGNEDPYFGLALAMQVPQMPIAVNNYHLMMRFVLHGVGVAVMDELCFKTTAYGADWSPLVCYPLDHILPNVLYGILVRRHKHLSPQAKALMESLRQFFTDIPTERLMAPGDTLLSPAPTEKRRPKAPRM